MRIAVPSETADGLESIRSGHFGHAPYFTVIEIEGDTITDVRSVRNVEHDELGCSGVIDHAIGLGLDGILTIGMGRPPMARFAQAGVTVYSETQTPKVGDVMQLFLAGKVHRMNPADACAH